MTFRRNKKEEEEEDEEEKAKKTGWSLAWEATKSKESNYLSTPVRVLVASRCTKPFLPRRSQTRGEGGKEGREGPLCEPLPHKRTARSMRRASPCSIDRREPLMPSIALLGLVEAESAPSEQMKRDEETPSSHLNSSHLICCVSTSEYLSACRVCTTEVRMRPVLCDVCFVLTPTWPWFTNSTNYELCICFFVSQ